MGCNMGCNWYDIKTQNSDGGSQGKVYMKSTWDMAQNTGSLLHHKHYITVINWHQGIINKPNYQAG